MRHERIPLILLTGFLGSGKTTLLNQLVQLPEFSRTLVIINEFGETSLDHLLVSKSSDDQIVELSSGCICCTIRGDLAKTLGDATWRFARNGERQFDRVVIETTGLAEPTPILQIISNTPKLYDSYRMQGTVTVVDAVNGAGTLATHPEAQKQVAVADLLLLSKSDLATEAQETATREAMLLLNPTAPVQLVLQGQTQVSDILALDHAEPVQSSAPLHSWLPTDQLSFAPVSGKLGLLRAEQTSSPPVDLNRHNDRIRAYCYVLEHPVTAAQIDQWLDALMPELGPQLLRLKAILNVVGFPGPLVVHAVQHLLHPAGLLKEWPDEDRRCKLVFITDNLSAERLEQSLQLLQ